MTEPLIDELARTLKMSRPHRVWLGPILRAIDELGGSARPKDVIAHIRETTSAHLRPGQWSYIVRGSHIRWARLCLRKGGLIGGESGTWELTPYGRECLGRLRSEDFEVHDRFPDLTPGRRGDKDVPLKTLPATAFEAFHIPTLRILDDRGPTKKQDLFVALEQAIGNQFLEGDRGTLPNGHVVWSYRASWALTYLKKAGEVRNPSRAVWEITDSGRARLKADAAAWTIASYQTSKAKVHPANERTPRVAEGSLPPPTQDWTESRWHEARSLLGDTIFSALHRRLRPDLGPTPDLDGSTLARNVILYGPPGTGKTFLACAAARALTTDDEPTEDAAWHVVQFHPSYAYEDFIQGLRPDLEQKDLRYKMQKGPFLQLCETAENDPDSFYVLVIDEINRGDPARIFGELLYALEYRGQPVDLPTGGQLTVPPNLVVIGTMNSVDRSVALVDYALRRRFGFVRVDPNPDVIRAVRAGQPFAEVGAQALEALNEWLSTELGRDHSVGHSFFLSAATPLDAPDALEAIWELDIQPLLEEYFFGEAERVLQSRQRWSLALSEALGAAAEAADEDDAELGA